MDDIADSENLTVKALPRDDILISICFFDLPATDAAFIALRDIARRLDLRFHFRELILVVDEDKLEEYLPFVAQIKNLRLFSTRHGYDYYQRRLIAAEEAIGDFVIIGSFHEIAHVDIPKMLRQALDQNSILLAVPSKRRIVLNGLSLTIAALGRAAGFRANLNDLQTITLPRSQLNQILSHTDPELALRFQPRDPTLPLSFFTVESNLPLRGGAYRMKGRVRLLVKLLAYMSPMLLMFVSLSSFLLIAIGFGYTIYILWALIFIDNLAPGWFTTSSILGLGTTFMGISLLGLSLGMQQVVNHISKRRLEPIAHEVNRVDLFGKLASDLNIDLGEDTRDVVQEKK